MADYKIASIHNGDTVRTHFLGCVVAAFDLLSVEPSRAALKISAKPTENVTCAQGICSAIAPSANLNVVDLETLLSSGDVTVSAGGDAKDIEIDAPFKWTQSSGLTLNATGAIDIKKQVRVAGLGSLSIATDAGIAGVDLHFEGGNISFPNASNALTINGNSYVLVKDIPQLARMLKRNNGTGRFFALADSGTSKQTYTESPINKKFNGTFEGLGNTISGLKITGPYFYVGLFYMVGWKGVVRDLQLENVSVSGGNVGALAGANDGVVEGCKASGQVTSDVPGGWAAGLVGGNTGLIVNSRASVDVSDMGVGAIVGGLVGYNRPGKPSVMATIEQSYATGSLIGAKQNQMGGLVGFNAGGTVLNPYATSPLNGGDEAIIGGLVGTNSTLGGNPIVTASYSIGSVAGGGANQVGGLIGYDQSGIGNTNDYWDLDTSGIDNPAQGAGNFPNDPGITGLSDTQLKSGLPAGFDKAIWKKNANINNGYPYLIANPPPK